MSQSVLKIRFPGVKSAEASARAQELEECLNTKARAKVPQLEVRREPERGDTQGLGEVLVAVLPYVPDVAHTTATVALVLVESIHVWLLMRQRGEKSHGPGSAPAVPLELEGSDGKRVSVDPGAPDLAEKVEKALGLPPKPARPS